MRDTGGWTEVRRHKDRDKRRNDRDTLSNFYVSGFPDGIKKEELKDPFSKFGTVVDIYFGGKKDYRNKNFAFIRYTGGENPSNQHRQTPTEIDCSIGSIQQQGGTKQQTPHDKSNPTGNLEHTLEQLQQNIRPSDSGGSRQTNKGPQNNYQFKP
ncbi:hypothetical protein LXL04_039179 [Taraxacum kok-saghyz]